MEISTGLIYATICVLTLIYGIFKYKFSYWSRLGIPYIQPKIPFGNIEGIGRKLHTSQMMQRFYNEFKKRKNSFGGIFFIIKPAVIIVDLDLLKNILIKDFNYFHDRDTYYNEKDDPLSAHLFSLDGQKWRSLRSKLTPTFTSVKIKSMLPTIVEVGDKFQKTLRDMVSLQEVIEMKDVLSRFTIDVIGTCVFGIECNSLMDPHAEFLKMGKKVFDISISYGFKLIFITIFRKFALMLRMKITDKAVSRFFMNIVRETVDFREKNNVQRNDLMALLIELKKSGKLDKNGENDETGSLTLEEIAAQAFVFFSAGFETSATAISCSLYELALNQDIQNKARDEIDQVLKKHDGKFTYEAMMEMTYIEKIINESLRKYPPAANTFRSTSKDYKVENTNKIIKMGTTVWIPIYAIHHDPDIYPNPEVFNPERFTPEAIRDRHPMSFIPFGDGPRICIGLRFAMMQSLIALVTSLKYFRFTTSSKTTIPMTFSAKSIVLSPEGGLWLHVKPL